MNGLRRLLRPQSPDSRAASDQLWLKAGLLFGLGALLLSRILGGTLLFYIGDQYTWLTQLASAGFFMIGGIYLWMRRSRPEEGAACHDHGHDHHHDHHHGHSHGLSWRAVALIALPIVLGFAVTPQPLGASAMQGRELSVGVTDSVMPPAVRRAENRPPEEWNILDWVLAFQSANAPGGEGTRQFDGETARIIGFVYHDSQDAADEFWLIRFVVGCCVADASPVGLRIHWPHSLELAQDTWVQVQGVMRGGGLGELPILLAQDITEIPAPNQPYLYP